MTSPRRQAWAIAGALLLGFGLTIAAAARSSAPRLDRKAGGAEWPKPLPPVYRTYGQDAYGSGPYGR